MSASTRALRWTITGHTHMLDSIFIVGGLAFFAISVGYTIVCERL